MLQLGQVKLSMNKKDLYPKAIAVYEAVLMLLKEGRDMTKLTVADIAKAAGIGKGTTYDYFSSKDEIIAKSLVYGFKSMIDYVADKLEGQHTLHDKISVLYDTAMEFEYVKTMGSQVFGTVFASGTIQDKIIELFKEEKSFGNCYGAIIDALTQCAVDEGLITQAVDKDYIYYTFMSMFQLAFSPMSCMMRDKMDVEAQKKYLYQMILGALKNNSEK